MNLLEKYTTELSTTQILFFRVGAPLAPQILGVCRGCCQKLTILFTITITAIIAIVIAIIIAVVIAIVAIIIAIIVMFQQNAQNAEAAATNSLNRDAGVYSGSCFRQ